MTAPGGADAALCRQGPRGGTERPYHSTAGFREKHGVKVFREDATMVTYHTNVSNGASLSAGQTVIFAFSCHRRYSGAPGWEGSLHQGSELSYGRQPHLVVSPSDNSQALF